MTPLVISGAWEPSALPNGEYVAPMKSGGVLKTHRGDRQLPNGQSTLRFPVVSQGNKIAGTGQTDNLAWLYDGTTWTSRPCFACPRACIFLPDGSLRVVLTSAETGSQGFAQVSDAGQVVLAKDQREDSTRRLWEYVTRDGITIGLGGDGPDGPDPLVAQVRDGSYRLIQRGDCNRLDFQKMDDRISLAWYEPKPAPVFAEAHMRWLTVSELEAMPVYQRQVKVPTIPPFTFPTAVIWFFENSKRPSVTPSPAPGQWSLIVESGLNPPKPVIIGLTGDDNEDLIGEWRNRWSQVRGIYVADEASRNGLQQKAKNAKALMIFWGLQPRPIYSYSAANVWTDIPEIDFLGVQLYPEPGETTAQSETRFKAALAKAAGKRVWLVCGACDRRPLVGVTEAQLVALVPLYAMLAALVKAGAVGLFAWGRQGGASSLPGLRPILMSLAAAVVTLPTQPVVTPPKPPVTPPVTPVPPPEEPEMPLMTFDESLSVMQQAARKWRTLHNKPADVLDEGQCHIWLWRLLVEGYSAQRLLESVT